MIIKKFQGKTELEATEAAKKELGSNIVTAAKKYLGYNEANGSYKLFTNGRTEAWCADFSTYVTKEAFKASGKAVPKGFGSASVEGLRQWGIKNNCYLKNRRLI